MITELFTKAHDESLLKSSADLVARFRKEGIQVFAVPHFDGAQMMFLGVGCESSVATQMTSGDNAIIINSKAVEHAADMVGLTYAQALEAILWHERGHLFLLEHAGEADSETQSWDFAAQRASLTKNEMDRLWSFCQHGIQPAFKPQPKVDLRSPWLQRFDELAPQLGYIGAWQATQGYRATLSADTLFAELRRAGWDFDTSWTIAHEGDVSDGLRQLAIDRMDKVELMRSAVPLEQFVPAGTSLKS